MFPKEESKMEEWGTFFKIKNFFPKINKNFEKETSSKKVFKNIDYYHIYFRFTTQIILFLLMQFFWSNFSILFF